MAAVLGRLAGFVQGVLGRLRTWEIADHALRADAERMGCEIARRWQAERTGSSRMPYVALELRGGRSIS